MRGFEFRLIFIFTLLWPTITTLQGAEQGLHQVYRVNIPSSAYPDKRLEGFAIKTVSSKSLISCAQECLKLFPRCKSYNYINTAGICELNSNGVSGTDSENLKEMKSALGAVFTEILEQKILFKHCSDHFKYGAKLNGLYYVQDTHHNWYPAYCDFTSEAGKAWALVLSFSYANRAKQEFTTSYFPKDDPLAEDNPNWQAYRLSRQRMESLQGASVRWRVTCNFATMALDNRDYLKARISELNLFTFDGKSKCGKVEYINVMGHNCSACTASFYQFDGQIFHHDGTATGCTFTPASGSVPSQDNFGFYDNTNTNFRCTSSNESTTSYWFGADIY
ncbi:uncharacterized protein LOC116610711 [Nematostella vectensis]|uniref:uncharacterized protein LOC116610711 n=1 Tax=Nematostella vectensis TaxID=45351 RepID=UPI00207756A5|nr:uncharacterized protein LOC116610711 [Nematostella vectensis]